MPADDVFKVEVAFTTATWATPTWTDVTNLTDAERSKRGVREFTLTTGREGGRWAGARLEVVFNNLDGDWDQANSGSVFGVANLKRNKKIRLRVSDDNFTGSGTLFVGYIDDIIPAGDNLFGTATVVASDLSRLLAEYDVADLVRPLEFSGDRVTAILDAVGVPAGERSTIQNGSVLMPAATLASDAWSLLQECARAEQGLLYVNPSGRLSYLERHQFYATTHFSVRQHSFVSNTIDPSASAIKFAPVVRTLGAGKAVTRVTASRAGGDDTFVYDTTAANEPPVTPSADTPHGLAVAYDAMVEFTPHVVHKGWGFDGQRIGSIEVQVWPGANGNALAALEASDYQPMTRVEVQTRPVGYSTDWNLESTIETLTLRGDPERMDATLTFSPYLTDLESDASSLWYQFGATLDSFDLGAP